MQVFTTAERVPSPYREVALLNSKGESSWTDEKGMLDSQRRKAAEVGANGLIRGETKEPNAGTKIIGSLFGTGAERKGRAIAIWIPMDSGRTQENCSGRKSAAALERTEHLSQPPAYGTTPPPAPAPRLEDADRLPPERYYYQTEIAAQADGNRPGECR